jgi:hypothetical protein
MVHIRIERHGAVIRQHCPACHGETDKHNVQAFCFENDDPICFGALCEECLKAQHVGELIIRGRVPTYEALEHRRAEEEEA